MFLCEKYVKTHVNVCFTLFMECHDVIVEAFYKAYEKNVKYALNS